MKLVLLTITMIITGCVTQGRDFSSNVKWIEEKKTDVSAVKKFMGQPYAVGISGGKKTLTYGYYRYKVFGKSYVKELKVYLEGDKVSRYTFTSSFPRDTNSQRK